MKIDIFTLCDGVYCYEDKLTIIGVYDVLRRLNLTATPIEINIAAHIVFDENECGENSIHIYGEDAESGMAVLDLNNNNFSITKREKLETGVLNVALSKIPVLFPRAGKYRFTLEVIGKGKSEILLTVD